MKKKNYYLRIFTALLLLANPNIHIIDILPDFIAAIFFVLTFNFKKKEIRMKKETKMEINKENY